MAAPDTATLLIWRACRQSYYILWFMLRLLMDLSCQLSSILLDAMPRLLRSLDFIKVITVPLIRLLYGISALIMLQCVLSCLDY